MTFSALLISTRKRLRLSQAALAAVLDVSPRVLWDWEHGVSEPRQIEQEGARARIEKLSVTTELSSKTAAASPASEPTKGQPVSAGPQRHLEQ